MAINFQGLKKIFSAVDNEKFYPFYLLVLSAAILFFQLKGSIGSWDEAIYSEVAREGILNNSWIDLHYRGVLWLEKPPLAIWLTMVSFKIFGINEFATWFFPVIFGILGVMGTYYLAKCLFNSKIGFLSSLVLLSIPHYILMSRNNMMDIFLVSSSLISFLFLIKSNKDSRYLILSATFLGMAFMFKNVIALLNLPVFLYYLYLNNRLGILKDKYFYLSLTIFLAIVLPWHLIMFFKYKWMFLNDYIGYHLIERYNKNILNTDYSSDIFYYFKVIARRAGSWWFVLLATLPIVLKDIKNKIKHKELKLFLFWMIFIFIFFTSSTTKLHHYILPLYIPFSVLIAYGLYNSYLRRSILAAVSVFILFMNIDQSVILRVSDFGESRLLFPLVLYKLFHLPTYLIYAFVTLLIVFVFYNYFSKSKILALKISFLSIFLFSFLLPFYPERGIIAKRVGNIIQDKNIETIYYSDYGTEQNLENPLVYYGYPAKVEFLRARNDVFSENSSSYCLKSKSHYHKSKKLDYEFYPCEIVQ